MRIESCGEYNVKYEEGTKTKAVFGHSRGLKRVVGLCICCGSIVTKPVCCICLRKLNLFRLHVRILAAIASYGYRKNMVDANVPIIQIIRTLWSLRSSVSCVLNGYYALKKISAYFIV